MPAARGRRAPPAARRRLRRGGQPSEGQRLHRAGPEPGRRGQQARPRRAPDRRADAGRHGRPDHDRRPDGREGRQGQEGPALLQARGRFLPDLHPPHRVPRPRPRGSPARGPGAARPRRPRSAAHVGGHAAHARLHTGAAAVKPRGVRRLTATLAVLVTLGAAGRASVQERAPNNPHLYSKGSWGQSYADQYAHWRIGLTPRGQR